MLKWPQLLVLAFDSLHFSLFNKLFSVKKRKQSCLKCEYQFVLHIDYFIEGHNLISSL